MADYEEFFIQLADTEWFSARAAVPRPDGMSEKQWAWCVLGLGDSVGPRSTIPYWAWGVEGLDESLRPMVTKGGDRPEPRLIRSPEDSEEIAAEWLRYFGFDDAACTGAGADGGVDVEGSDVVAQVKAEAKPTGRPIVQQIRGIAAHKGVECAVFSLAGYSTEALGWADEAGVALFQFDLQGEPQAENESARLMEERVDPAHFSALEDSTAATETFLGTEVETTALTALALRETLSSVEAFEERWDKERTEFTKLARLPKDRRVPGNLIGIPYWDWYSTWGDMWRTAREVFGMARLMEQLDTRFILEPILPQIVWVLNEPDLSRMAEGFWDKADGSGFTDEEMEAWISRRELFEGDAEFELTELSDEDEAFIRRNSTMLDDWTRATPPLPERGPTPTAARPPKTVEQASPGFMRRAAGGVAAFLILWAVALVVCLPLALMVAATDSLDTPVWQSVLFALFISFLLVASLMLWGWMKRE